MNDRHEDYTLTYSEFIEYNHKQQLLGNGGFGKVYKTTDSKQNVYAMKVIDIREVTHRYMLESPMKTRTNTPARGNDNNEFQQHILTSLLNEVKIMRNLDHPNIISIYHYYMNDGCPDRQQSGNNLSSCTPQKPYMNPQNLYIIMEYSSHGSLLKYIQSQQHQCLSELVTAAITSNILDGLVYLANLSIIHGDIKAANILIFPNGVVKLCDFGLSFQWNDENLEDYNEDVQGDNKRLQKIATNGSAYWLAPEIILHRMATPKSDVWSLGATIIEMLTGYPPFSKKGPLSACHAVGSGTKIDYPSGISKECISFLDDCFQFNPTLRSRARTLKSHPWMKHIKKNIMEFVDIDGDDTYLGLEEKQTGELELNNSLSKKNKKMLESFREKDDDFQFNDCEIDISDLQINTEKETTNTNMLWKLRHLTELQLKELENMNVVDDEIYLSELKHNYISSLVELLRSITAKNRIPRTEQLLRIGKEYLRMHPSELQRFCLSGSLVPLASAKKDHRLGVETVRLIQMLVLGAFKSRGEEWLAASGFKPLSRQ